LGSELKRSLNNESFCNMPLLAFFTLPSWASFSALITDFSGGLFTDLLAIAGIIVGATIAGMGIAKLISVVIRGVSKVIGNKSMGRRKRR